MNVEFRRKEFCGSLFVILRFAVPPDEVSYEEGSTLLLDGKDGLVAECPEIVELLLLDHGPQLLTVHIEKSERFSVNDDGKQHECLGGNGFEIPIRKLATRASPRPQVFPSTFRDL